MRYSVIILTFGDRLPALQRCIEKVRAGARTLRNDYEIIVVNNGSEAAGLWLLQAEGIRSVARETNEGVCARNYGIDVARGDYIIQVDDDVLVSPGFDEILLKPYENPEIGATGPHGFYQDSTWGLLIDDRRRPQPGQFCDLVMGYCWSWRNQRVRCSLCKGTLFRNAMPCEACGGEGADRTRFRYDWAFSPFWHEESDLQCQIRAAGYRIMCTAPVATHQTLHDWTETKADGPITGESIARRNFFKLVDKWQEKGIRFEGPAVGLRGAAPGRRATR